MLAGRVRQQSRAIVFELHDSSRAFLTDQLCLLDYEPTRAALSTPLCRTIVSAQATRTVWVIFRVIPTSVSPSGQTARYKGDGLSKKLK